MDNPVTTTEQQAAPAPGTATSTQFSFFFRTDKVRDDEGKVIGAGRKHPDVKAVLPIPTYADLTASKLAQSAKSVASSKSLGVWCSLCKLTRSDSYARISATRRVSLLPANRSL